MSDLETRLRDTLSERAGAAPDALGLATGARRRLRRRRTTWAVAAAAVVAAGVPVGLSQLAPSSDGGGRIADEPTATSGLPPGVIETGYRAESWHDVTFEVPVDWGYGGTSGWCALGGDTREARARGRHPPRHGRADDRVLADQRLRRDRRRRSAARSTRCTTSGRRLAVRRPQGVADPMLP